MNKPASQLKVGDVIIPKGLHVTRTIKSIRNVTLHGMNAVEVTTDRDTTINFIAAANVEVR